MHSASRQRTGGGLICADAAERQGAGHGGGSGQGPRLGVFSWEYQWQINDFLMFLACSNHANAGYTWIYPVLEHPHIRI